MPSTTTLNEATRSPIDGTEYIRSATSGANWKQQLSAQWAFGSIVSYDAFTSGVDPMPTAVGLSDFTAVNASNAAWNFATYTYGNNAVSGGIGFYKSRGGSLNAHGAMQAGDSINAIYVLGDDGFNPVFSAALDFQADLTFSSSSGPGRILFSTTSSGSNAYAERLRIDSSGVLTVRPNIGVTTTTGVASVIVNNNGWSLIEMNSWDNALNSQLSMWRARGTFAAASTVQNGDVAGQITGNVRDHIGNNITAGEIRISVDGTVSSASCPGRISLWATPSGPSAGTTERLRIDSAGNTFLGASVSTTSLTGFSLLNLTNNGHAAMELDAFDNSLYPEIYLYRSRGTFAVPAAVQTGNVLGSIVYTGRDSSGGNMINGAQIQGLCDATPSANNVPARLVFFTTQSSAGSALLERLRIDSSGRVTLSSTGNFANKQLEVTSDVSTRGQISIFGIGNNIFSPEINVYKTRDTSPGSGTTVQNGDGLLSFQMYGANGFGLQAAASINVNVDGTPSSNSMPGRLTFSTTTSGAVSATERLRIDSNGRAMLGGTASVTGVSSTSPPFQVHADTPIIADYAWSATNSCSFDANRSRSATIGTHTILQSGDIIGSIRFAGSDGFSFQNGAQIVGSVDAAPSSNSMPGQLSFATSTSGSVTPTERMRIDRTGAVFFPSVGTTGSAANGVLVSGSSPANQLLRSTSSLRYKTRVTSVPQLRIDAAAAVRPVEYTSTAIADAQVDTRFIGYIAEEVAEVDPELVFMVDGHPDGVMYDRVLLLKVAKLEQKVRELERRLH